jgi:hypothetical protein
MRIWRSSTVGIGALSLLLTAFFGCEGPKPTDPPIPIADLGIASDDPKTLDAKNSSREKNLDGVRFTVPENWNQQELPPTLAGMIDSRYTIETEHGDMELTLTGMGGGAAMNLDRWIGQIKMAKGDEAKRFKIEIDGIESQWVDVRGAYASRMAANSASRDDYRLVGGVVPNTPRDFTIKLLGPRKAVAEFHDEFMQFCKSIKMK